MATAGDIHESGPAYCSFCNKVSTIIEYCIHGESEFSEAAWTHPYVECCFSEDTDRWTDLTEHETAIEVIEALAKKIRDARRALA